MSLRALESNEPLDRFLEIKAEIEALQEELERLKPEITAALWEEPEHQTLYRGCEITLSVRKSYQYSEAVKANEKALREAKMKERFDGTAVVVRAVSFPVVKALATERAA